MHMSFTKVRNNGIKHFFKLWVKKRILDGFCFDFLQALTGLRIIINSILVELVSTGYDSCGR